MFQSKEEKDNILKIAAGDNIVFGKRALLLISIFEIIMIIGWLLGRFIMNSGVHIEYLFGYSFLLLASAAAYFFLNYVQSDFENRYRLVRTFSTIYDGFLILWALYLTIIDVRYVGDFSSLIFTTIIVITPIVSMIRIRVYVGFHVFGCVSMLLIIHSFDNGNVYADTVNFIVFAFISLIAGLSYYNIKYKGYQRQVAMDYATKKDTLSNLYNRKKLEEMVEFIWKDCVIKNSNITCILCDIDDFKSINDEYGHLVGDEWIKRVADVLKESLIPGEEFCFRFGGEEFLVILPEKGLMDGERFVKTVQSKVALLNREKDILKVTLSYGIYEGKPSLDKESFNSLFSKADELMYQAKKNGKNQYCMKKGE